jgi:predicted TIM-barrel fold metal-dependent hydrolase
MRLSSQAQPPYADVTAMARTLVAQAPNRLVWGSDWPHVNLPTPAPAYPVLLDLLHHWAPDASTCQRILVDNPRALYGLATPPEHAIAPPAIGPH